MAEVTPADVASLQEGDAASAISLITTMAKAYTRGRGFTDNEPNDEIAAAITTATTRLVANSSQISHSLTSGPFVQDLRTHFTGWTLAEQMVLNRYRKTAL